MTLESRTSEQISHLYGDGAPEADATGSEFMNETAEEIRTVGRVDIRYLGECALGCPGESLRCS